MRASHVFFALLTVLLTGCALVYGSRQPDPEERLARGLAALDREDYRSAFDDLVWVYTHFPDEPEGRRALLALAAAELDPRNPSRRLGVGSDLVADYLRTPGTPSWTHPVAETVYLLALELGAAETRVAEAEMEREEAEQESAEARGEATRARRQAQRAEAEAQRARRAEARAERARRGAQAAPPGPLPQLPGPPVTARIRELQRERDRLAQRVQALERELERIRKTLRP
ncbi:MAG TPA: hypothetical protein VF188_15200 [Longimicrobiales bacterium]